MEGKTIAPIEVKMGFKWQGLLLSVIVGMAIWLIPIPEGLSAKAWGMLALFVATIVAIIAKAMPMGAATLVALVISGLTGLTPLSRQRGSGHVIRFLQRNHLVNRYCDVFISRGHQNRLGKTHCPLFRRTFR